MRLVCKRWLAIDDAIPEEPTRLTLQLERRLLLQLDNESEAQYFAYHLRSRRRLVKLKWHILHKESLVQCSIAFSKLSDQAQALRTLEFSPPAYDRPWNRGGGVQHPFSLLALLTQLRELRLTDWGYTTVDVCHVHHLSGLINLEVGLLNPPHPDH